MTSSAVGAAPVQDNGDGNLIEADVNIEEAPLLEEGEPRAKLASVVPSAWPIKLMSDQQRTISRHAIIEEAISYSTCSSHPVSQGKNLDNNMSLTTPSEYTISFFGTGYGKTSLGTSQKLDQASAIRRFTCKRKMAAPACCRLAAAAAAAVAAFVAASAMAVTLIKFRLIGLAARDSSCKHGSVCEWEVIYPFPVRSRRSPSFSSPTVATNPPGSVVVGRAENEAWLRLVGDTGFIAFNMSGIKVLRRKEDIWYEKVVSGSCAEAGRRPIIDPRSCEIAAMAIGLAAIDKPLSVLVDTADQVAMSTTAAPWDDGSRPEGCYMDATGSPRLNMHPGSIGNGAIGGMQPLCATMAYPMTNTRTSTTSTTTTSTRTSTTRSTTTSTRTSTTSATTTSTRTSTTRSTTTNTRTSTTSATTTSTSTSTTSATTTSTRTSTTSATTTSTRTSTASTATTSMTSRANQTAITIRSYGEPSFMCFSYMRKGTGEEQLVKMQLRKSASIFACDQTVVVSSGKFYLGKNQYGEDVFTWANPPTTNERGNLSNPGVTTSSWLNSLTFITAFNTILDDSAGRIWSMDFFVKADPDVVLLPDRLRHHVRAPIRAPVYFLNCQDKDVPILFGAVEIFSEQAMRLYQEGRDRCILSLNWRGWGEDTFFSSCMTILGAQALEDFALIGDARCGYAPCTDHWRAAFHPFKDVVGWDQCWRETGTISDD